MPAEAFKTNKVVFEHFQSAASDDKITCMQLRAVFQVAIEKLWLRYRPENPLHERMTNNLHYCKNV